MYQACNGLSVRTMALFVAFSSGMLIQETHGQSGGTLLELIPADSLFVVRANDFKGTLEKLDVYLGGASPIPVSLAMLANMQLGQMLGDPMLTGVDQNGNFALFGLAPRPNETEPLIGLLLPVTDYSAFVQSHPHGSAQAEGLTLLTLPDSPLGNLLLSPTPSNQYALIVPENNKQALTSLQQAINDTAGKELSDSLSSIQATHANTASIWVYANLKSLYASYQQAIQEGFSVMREAYTTIQEATPASSMTEFMELYLIFVEEMITRLLSQADSVTVALTPEATVLSIDYGFRAKAASDLSNMLVENPKAKSPFQLTEYLDNDNAVNGLMKMNSSALQEMYAALFVLVEKVFEGKGTLDALDMTEVKALTQKAFAAMGDSVSFSFSYASGMPMIRMREAVGVQDKAKMKEVMADGMALTNTFYEAMGLPVTLKYHPDAETYKDVAIDKISIDMEALVAQSAQNDEAKKMLEKMYGDEFVYYTAITDKVFFMTMGDHAKEDLITLLDQPAAVAPNGDIRIAMDLLADPFKQDMVMSVNIIKLFKGMGEMMRGISVPGGAANPFGTIFEGISGESKSCLAVGASVYDGEAVMRVALPKEHLIEIVAVVMQIQQKMMQQQTPPEEVGPQSVETLKSLGYVE